jgi:hypothetical protein
VRVSTKEEAGKRSNASGLENAKAVGPATLVNEDSQALPDEKSGSAGDPNGDDLLDRALAFVKRFVSLPSDHAALAVVLWVAHTHLMDAWDTTPRIAFLSAEPGSGKSRAMEIAALLAPLALEAANATSASLVRAMGDPAGTPTFFIDEIDTKYGPKAKGDEELRSLINAGFRRGGSFLRCEKTDDDWVPVRANAYAAIAVAGIGDLPDTILTRSVIVKMRKRGPGERVEPYRHRDHQHIGHKLRDELAAWADHVCEEAAKCRPALPNGIADRNADVWEPLIVVADLAGGAWPQRAREAALHFVTVGNAEPPPSLGVRLLRDIHACFGQDEKLRTKDLLGRLLADPEAPWGDLAGKKLNDRKLADLLRPYGIGPETIRMPDGSTPRGYKREAFHDPWQRHLPPPALAATAATPATTIGLPRKTADPRVADEVSRCGEVAELKSRNP